MSVRGREPEPQTRGKASDEGMLHARVVLSGLQSSQAKSGNQTWLWETALQAALLVTLLPI